VVVDGTGNQIDSRALMFVLDGAPVFSTVGVVAGDVRRALEGGQPNGCLFRRSVQRGSCTYVDGRRRMHRANRRCPTCGASKPVVSSAWCDMSHEDVLDVPDSTSARNDYESGCGKAAGYGGISAVLSSALHRYSCLRDPRGGDRLGLQLCHR